MYKTINQLTKALNAIDIKSAFKIPVATNGKTGTVDFDQLSIYLHSSLGIGDYLTSSGVYKKDETYSRDEIYSRAQTYSRNEFTRLLALKANNSVVYTKTELNKLLLNKANVSETYTKSKSNELLSLKANVTDVFPKTSTYSRSSLYTKTVLDSKLSQKADRNATYTKSEVNSLISNYEGGGSGNGYTIEQTNVLLASKASTGFAYAKTATYSSAEMDSIVADMALKSLTYTKDEVDNKIPSTANFATTTYVNQQLTGLNDAKADKNVSYSKSEVYTKTESQNEFLTFMELATLNYTKTQTITVIEQNSNVSFSLENEFIVGDFAQVILNGKIEQTARVVKPKQDLSDLGNLGTLINVYIEGIAFMPDDIVTLNINVIKVEL